MLTVCAVLAQLCDDAQHSRVRQDSGLDRSRCRADQKDVGYCDGPRGLSVRLVLVSCTLYGLYVMGC